MWAAAAAALGGAAFLFDILMPQEVAGAILFVALVLLGLWIPHRSHVPLLAAAATLLTIAGLFFSPEGSITWAALINRALALLAVWTTAYVVYLRRREHGQSRPDVPVAFQQTLGTGPAPPRQTGTLELAPQSASEKSAVLEAALDSMAQGFCAFDAENRLIAFNDKYREYFGFPPGFLRIGMSHEEIFRFRIDHGYYGDVDPEETLKKLLARSSNPSERTVEQTAAGGRFHIFHRRPIPGGGYVNTYTDINRLKKAEREAAAKSAYLEGIFKAGGTAYCIVDQDFKLVDHNKAYEKLFGFPPGFLRPGLPREEVTRRRYEMGHFGDETLENVLKRRSQKRWVEAFNERSLPDGTSYVYRRKPLPQGGYVTSYTETTALKQAQWEAEEKSKLLDTALQTMGQGFVIYDSDQRVAAYNDRFVESAGLPAGCDPTGMSHEQILRLRAREGKTVEVLDEDTIRRRVDGRTKRPVVVRERTREDGTAFIYHRVPLPGGGSVATYTDITQLKKAEREAAAKSAYLEAIFKTGVTAYCIVDQDFRLVDYNEAYEQLFGFPKGFLRPGLTHEEITHYRHKMGHFKDETLEQTHERRRANRHLERFNENTLPNGTSYVYQRKTLPGGGYVTSFIETTALHQARAEAEEKSRLLNTALATMAQGFVLYDSSQKIVAYNNKFIEMTGLPEDCDPTGMSHEEILRLRAARGNRGQPLTEDIIQLRLKRHRDGFEQAVKNVREDGTAFLYHRIRIPGGGTVSTYTDITEQKRAEDRLHQAQKMEMIGQLTGGVAHDFNNLLAVIHGNAELLADGHGDRDKMTGAILHAATRGSELTQRLLSFSRRQPLFPKPFDLAELVEGLREMLERTLGESIRIETRPEAGLWLAEADPGQVENALLNLAINARDAMPEGGKLVITCQNAVLDNNFFPVSPEIPGNEYVVVAVSDTGTGMPQEVLDHAFEPFYSTKEVGQGSGLGLSMVYGFAKQSGGHVTIDSEEGWGTTVRLYLPRGTDSSRTGTRPQADDAPPRSRGARILVIEDDPAVRELVSGMLKALGYQAVTADTCAGALDVLSREKVDLVLSDVVLSDGISGKDFVGTAETLQPELKVIFMSGYPAHVADRRAPEGTTETLLIKPFRKNDLARAVNNALADDAHGDAGAQAAG